MTDNILLCGYKFKMATTYIEDVALVCTNDSIEGLLLLNIDVLYKVMITTLTYIDNTKLTNNIITYIHLFKIYS